MIKNFKFLTVVIFFLFCITSFLLVIDKSDTQSESHIRPNGELFHPGLKRLNSVNKVIAYADSIYSTLNLQKFDTAAYVDLLNEILKKRFHHGLAKYSLSENWIAFLSGKIVWSHLSAIVNADDILKHSESLCSQQNIVFIKALRLKNISTRTVGLGRKEGPGHFLIEVEYNKKWHLYDIDLEPNWDQNSDHKSMEYFLANKNELNKIYANRLDKRVLDKLIEKVTYGVPNQFPAKNMLLFHKFTVLLMYVLPIIFLLLFIYLLKKIKKGNNA